MYTQKISDKKSLMIITRSNVSNERGATATVLPCLEEIDRRKIYLEHDCESMLKFCTKELCYSETAAIRRIKSARLLRDVPTLLPAIAAGKLTLSNLSLATEFFKGEKIKNPAQKKSIIENLQGKSSREAEKLLFAQATPDSNFRRKSRIKRVSATDWELTVTITNELKTSFDKIRELKSHSIQNFEDLLTIMATQTLKNLEPKPSVRKPTAITTARVATPTQKRHLLHQANCQCEYINPKTQQRCQATHYLEADHIIPAAKNGKTELKNLRILCRAHNQWRAMK